ncbi:MAG: rhodanese-like domain-containing protein [Myxococcota bacterium]
MTIKGGVGFQDLLAEANAEVDEVSPEALRNQLADDDLVLVDLRDIRELNREGKLPGAVHTPRGMLEFWIDPASPYAKPIFQEEKRFVFYCQSGWRSALATAVAKRLGLQQASHLGGGFQAWKELGGAIEPHPAKKPK